VAEQKHVRLTETQAMRVLETCGWRIESTEEYTGKLAFRAVSPDGEAYTNWYYDTHSAIFYALTGHIGNGYRRETAQG
jgi:hypothetical protein